MKESFQYKPENAEAYKALGIEGTSFEFSYKEAEKVLGNLSGKTVLDFGSGAGRGARFLKNLGAKSVIGVDHNETMIEQAKSENTEGIEYVLIEKDIPIPDESVDKAFSSQVLMEMATKEDMTDALKEIARVLKPQGELVLIVTNPAAWGHDFVSYNYPDSMEGVKSGDTLTCIIKGDDPFAIKDYYWEEKDYGEVLARAGFEIESMTYPMPKSGDWLDEKKVAPDIVIVARKI